VSINLIVIESDCQSKGADTENVN